MPPRKINRPSRIEQLQEYYSKLKNDEDRIDFIFSQFSQKSMDVIKIKADEDNVVGVFCDKVMLPYTVNENGKEVLDIEKAQKNIRYFCRKMVDYELQTGLEYKKILDSLPEDTPNREATAGYYAKYSIPGSLMELGNTIMGNIAIAAPADQDLSVMMTNFMEEARIELSATLSDEEKEAFAVGNDLRKQAPALFEHKSPDKCGFDKKKINDLEDASYNTLTGSIDRNWMSDDTLDHEQVFFDPQLNAERNNRMQQHYMALDDPEDKLNFILEGTLGCNVELRAKGSYHHKPVNTKDTDHEKEVTVDKKGYFSDAEKKEFNKCLTDYLSPKKADGSPDLDEFERRMDALAYEYKDYRQAQGNFIANCKNNTNDKGEYSVTQMGITGTFTKGSEFDVSNKLCPEALKANALMKSLDEVFSGDGIKDEYVQDYYARKKVNKPLTTNMHMMRQAFEKTALDMARDAIIHDDGFFTYRDAKKEGSKAYESEDMDRMGNKLAANLSSEGKNKMSWKEPWKDVTLDPLKKLDNLYSQVKDADHWYHIDSKEFKEFKSSLEDAHKKYESLTGIGRNINDREKREIQALFDNVQKKSVKYLGNKAEKARGSDMGEERYQIALSALDVSSHGKAKETVDFHNTFRVRSGSKTVSFNDLNERATQNSQQRKEALKARREAEKSRKKVNLLDDNGPEKKSSRLK